MSVIGAVHKRGLLLDWIVFQDTFGMNWKVFHTHIRQSRQPFQCTSILFPSHLRHVILHNYYWDPTL